MKDRVLSLGYKILWNRSIYGKRHDFLGRIASRFSNLTLQDFCHVFYKDQYRWTFNQAIIILKHTFIMMIFTQSGAHLTFFGAGSSGTGGTPSTIAPLLYFIYEDKNSRILKGK